tara:strand:+ start:108 stop:404 length:297 start_codon:yes stop_codon:yes gene_type:complete
MKKFFIIIFLQFFLVNYANSSQITNIEWTILKDIQVTLYKPNARSLDKATCTAFYIPENNKPIGGGFGYYDGGVAQVRISLPRSYNTKILKNFKITCK